MHASGRSCNYSEVHSWLRETWSMVVCSQSNLDVTGAREGNKNATNTLFFVWNFVKKMNLFPVKQVIIFVLIRSTKFSKKGVSNLYEDNKLLKVFGDVSCPECKNEKYAYISNNIFFMFHNCKTCTTRCRVLKIPFNERKPRLTLTGGSGTYCFRKHRDYTKPHLLLKKFFTNQNLPQTNLNRKRLKPLH